MNLKPKPRPLWQRCLISASFTVLLGWKFLHLPTFFFPTSLRSIMNNWTYSMFWVIIKSLATRAYIDQPCTLKVPAALTPKIHAPPEYQLSLDEMRGLYENGFVGPFDCFSEQEIGALRADLVHAQQSVSKTYNWVSERDRHLECPHMMEMIRHPAITERLAQFLGPDLLVWRSQIFFKMPGTRRIQFHQASTYMVEDYLDPALYPPNRNELFQLTAWVAVDPATIENGCLEFVRGSQRQIWTINFGENQDSEGFYKANFKVEADLSQSKISKVTMKPGQFIIFTERCLHGSGPNTTDTPRFGFNIRVVPPNVAIYPHKEYYRSLYNGGKYTLKNWGAAILRGEDNLKLSRMIDVDRVLLNKKVA